MARLSPTPPLSLDFDGVSSLQPRCLEPCPGRLQPPCGLWCSDLPAQLWGVVEGSAPGLDHGERGWEVGWLPLPVRNVAGEVPPNQSSQSQPQNKQPT